MKASKMTGRTSPSGPRVWAAVIAVIAGLGFGGCQPMAEFFPPWGATPSPQPLPAVTAPVTEGGG